LVSLPGGHFEASGSTISPRKNETGCALRILGRLAAATDVEPFELIEGEEVLTRGTLAYFNKDQHSRLLRAI
jgi:hypothetical protein